ncbi:MAG: hypothetical protein M1376_19475 [Planctomycetes bacterium]|nr:hypothetical protein [Planctomycetota bacterium]
MAPWTIQAAPATQFLDLGKTPVLGSAELVGPRQPFAMFWYLPGLEPGGTYYWRVDEVEADGTTVHTGIVWSFTTQALTAYLPTPTDGATDASPTLTLTWLPGQTALKHHLYLSDDRDAVSQGTAAADKGKLTDPAFTPRALEAAATYYWRVDEMAPGSPPPDRSDLELYHVPARGRFRELHGRRGQPHL